MQTRSFLTYRFKFFDPLLIDEACSPPNRKGGAARVTCIVALSGPAQAHSKHSDISPELLFCCSEPGFLWHLQSPCLYSYWPLLSLWPQRLWQNGYSLERSAGLGHSWVIVSRFLGVAMSWEWPKLSPVSLYQIPGAHKCGFIRGKSLHRYVHQGLCDDRLILGCFVGPT